jgi:hypothetical protein
MEQKVQDGLKTFRQIEYDALRRHAKSRANAIENKREQLSGTQDMFASHTAEIHEATIDEIVAEQKELALNRLTEILETHSPIRFSTVVAGLLQAYMLRETNIKDLCVELARVGRIENTWGMGNKKPRDENFIILKSAANS